MEEEQIDLSEKSTSNKKSSKRLFFIVAIVMLVIVLICIVLTIIICVVLAASVPVTLLVLLATAVTLYVLYYSSDNSCNGPDCPADLIRVLNYTYDRINPCDDFHKFSCGRFEGDSGYPTFISSMRHKVVNDLNDIIAKPITSDDPPSLAMQKSFYNSCTNVYADERNIDASFYNILNLLGGWPIVNGSTWQEDNFQWWEAVQICADIGLNYDWFIDIDIMEDEDSKVYHLYVGYPTNFMRHADEVTLATYSRLMEDIAVHMGAPVESVPYEVERMMDFQKELYQIIKDAQDNEKMRIGSPENRKVIDLTNHMPGVDWPKFLGAITNRRFNYDDIVTVNSMRYIENLYQLLLKTPQRFKADYIVMRIIDELWPYLNTHIMNLYENYHEQVILNYLPLNRTEACLEEAQTRFPGVADAIYIRNTVDPRVKREVKELVSIIKYKLANHLKTATWLDDNAKNDAMVNITEVLEYIGGPDELFDQDIYEEILGFNGFRETDENVLQKVTHLNRLHSSRNFAKIEMPVDDDNSDPEVLLEQIDEFQAEEEDVTQVLPASFLRYEYYDATRPKYANYGSLATLISYKITHTFSDKLHEYLTSRKMTQWWSSLVDISEKTKCFPNDDLIDYYRILTDNGTIRIEKYFADNVAFDITFEAYSQWVKQHEPESVPSRFKYNSNQFFWIYSMQQLCSNSVEEEFYTQLRDRGNKLIQNSMYFANVFKCPPNSYMNPEEKCQIL